MFKLSESRRPTGSTSNIHMVADPELGPTARVPAGGTSELLMYAVSSTLGTTQPTAPQPTSPIHPQMMSPVQHGVGVYADPRGNPSSLIPYGAPMQMSPQSPWMQQQPPSSFPYTEWATPTAQTPARAQSPTTSLEEANSHLVQAYAEIARLQAISDTTAAAAASQTRQGFPTCTVFGNQGTTAPPPGGGHQQTFHPPPGLTEREAILEQILAATLGRNAQAATGREADRIPIGALPSQSDCRGWRKA